MKTLKLGLLILGLPLCLAQSAQATPVSDDFTQATDTNNWTAQDYACLTAGTSSNNTVGTNSNIPGCNYGTPDAAGSGALRLTPASGSQHGAIVSNYTFPSNQGLDVTFTTYSYGGSKDGLASEGADGISFFLMDGSYPVSYPTPGNSSTTTQNLGSWGGSLAYTCSNVNTPYIGMTGAYLGLGIDEYGNFLNGGSGNDNTATGIAVQTSNSSTNGYNSFTSGSYQQANRIGLRGAGNVSWYWLNANYPNLYPSSLSSSYQLAAVQNACKYGTLWNYAGAASATSQTITSATVSANQMTVTLNGPAYYVNGDSVTFTGLTPNAPAPISITGASMSGTNLTLNVASTSSFAASGQSVTLANLTTSGGSYQSVSGTPTLSGTSMTVTVVTSNSGYSAGQNVTFTGLTATNSTESISSGSISGGTLSLSVGDTSGYVIGQTVSLTGTVKATSTQTMSSFSCATSNKLSFAVGDTTGFVVGDTLTLSSVTKTGTWTPPSSGTISNISGTTVTINATGASSSNCLSAGKATKTVTYTGGTISSVSPFQVTVGTSMPSGSTLSVSSAAVSNPNANVTLSGPYPVASVSGSTKFVVTLPSNYTSLTANSAVVTNPSAAVTLNGTYTVTSLTGTSFTVTKSSATPVSIGVSGATATLPTGTISGSYTISNVNIAANTSFTVTLNGNPASITNSSGTATDTTQASVKNLNVTSLGSGPTLMDYAAIPNGYWVLPSSQKIANENTSSRSSAWPITYKLRITPAGILNFYYSYNNGAYQTVLKNWPITTSNGALPSNFRFGFAGSTGGSNNVHEITCFAAQPTESSSSATANTVQSGQVRTGNEVYLAKYDPNEWYGSLVSDPITVDSSGNASVSNTADWDANCKLTGGACTSMGVNSQGVATHNVTVQSPSSRNILTWDGSGGIGLEWSSLTTAQQTNLNSGGNGQQVLDWLRGGRTNEQSYSTPGPLRARSGVLGDIVNSSPVWVGPPAKNYGAKKFVDAINSNTGSESSYADFQKTYATRQSVVYVGANDGLLHGFRAGSTNSDGGFNTTNNDGQEVIAFMPSSIISNANIVNLSNAAYTHNYYVDATPGYGDLYYNSAWHTWLVGGVGTGGNEIFALDITDPTGAKSSSSQFSESNASSLVVGDWTSSSITSCTNATTNCGNNLGNTNGTPIIRRMHNGKWAIIFGNGLNSTSGKAGVFVGLVDSTTGAVSFVWLDTGWTGAANGINYVSSADLDGDFITDYLYAGDLQGNVWRFDVTSSDPTKWAASTFGQPSATPLFTAKDSSGNRQPITTSIAVTADLTGNSWRVILGLGTGQATPFTATASTTYQTGTQTIYGIWDWDMTAWNTASGNPTYASLAQVTSSPYLTFDRSNLNVNKLKTESNGYRTMATSTVCWADNATCSSTTPQYGWLFDLPDNNGSTGKEQLVYNPVFSGGELLLNTTIPPASSTNQCKITVPSGWTMAFDMATGGGEKQNVFPDANGNLAVTSGNYSIVGTNSSGVGTPYVVSVGSKQYAISQTSDGSKASVQKFNAQGGVKVKRISWEQLR